jgi:Uma2 family endonuclease
MNFAFNEVELPIRISLDRPITDDELLRLSAENDSLRLERDANGELIVMSPTGTGGGRVESRVYLALGNWAVADGRGEAYGPNTGFKLPDSSVRAADAAWMSSQRWDALDAEELKRFARTCPEFVIEVRSESDRLAPLQKKMQMWIANGADLAWLIDPIEKSVTIYRTGDQPEHLAHPTSVQGTGPIAGFELAMSRIWD